MAQGYPPRRSARPPARGRRGYPDEPGRTRRGDPRSDPGRPGRPSPDAFDDGLDEDLPPWAGPSIYPTGPGQRERRPPAAGRADAREMGAREAGRGEGRAGPPDAGEEWPQEGPDRIPGRRRAAAARARKSRRRLVAGGGLVVVVAAVVLWLTGSLPWQGQSAPSSGDELVTTFLPGELRSVPSACQALSAATLAQYLPGRVARVAQSPGGTQSQCTWTLDARPDFRVLTVSSQAFAPSLLSSGDGSATSGAIDAYGQQLQQLQSPPKSSRSPRAQLGAAVGLGRDAFTAFQVFRVGGAVTDEVTVVIRDRNVLIVVTMQGQQHGGGFGPVPAATLRAGALAACREVLAGLR